MSLGEEVTQAPAWTLLRTGARLRDYVQLAKVRLSLVVLLSGLVGYWLGAATVDAAHVFWFGLGTFLIIAGANAFNQVVERDSDARMARTAQRPLPSGRVSVFEAVAVASALSVAGVASLFLRVGAQVALLALLAFGTYVFVYTPLKSRTSWSIVPGAISGAIPPVMGWAAVRPELTPVAWSLFGVLFLWQFPHTWAIAATYRDDYANAGYCAPPIRGTALRTIACTAALVAVSLVPVVLGGAGALYLAGVLVAGAMALASAVRFGDGTLRPRATELLVVSLIYLPTVLALFALDGKAA